MKPPASWFELFLVAAGLMVAMLVVMLVQRPDATCTLPFESPRRLVLSRETDREHLASDLAEAARIARRHTRSAGNPALEHTGFVNCEATLVQQIAARHGPAPD